MKKNFIIYGIAVLVFIGIVVFYVNFRKSNEQASPPSDTGTDKKVIQPAPPNLGTKENPIFPIKVGSKGPHVAELQRGLNHQYFAIRKKNVLKPLDTDGDFGSITLAMLKDLYNVSSVSKDLAKQMYRDNGIFIMPEWIDKLT